MLLLSNSASTFQVTGRQKQTQSPRINRKIVQFPQVTDLLAETRSQEYTEPISILATRPELVNRGENGLRKSVICKCYKIPTQLYLFQMSRKSRRRTTLAPSGPPLLEVTAKIEAIKIIFIIDTGERISMLPLSIVNDILLDPSLVSISTANGEKINCQTSL